MMEILSLKKLMKAAKIFEYVSLRLSHIIRLEYVVKHAAQRKAYLYKPVLSLHCPPIARIPDTASRLNHDTVMMAVMSSYIE